MAAPDSTVWGSIVGGYCRLGIYKSLTSTATQTTVTVQIWFWSKYSCSDTGNTLYYNNLASSGSATTSVGAVSISTSVVSGSGWSTSNQQKLKEYSYTYTRGTSAATRYLYAKIINVDKAGGTMYASTSFSVPKLASYTISYNANGGSGAPASQTKYYGKNITLSGTKPTRTGYSFLGWATSASGSVAYAAGATYSGNANLTLYAKWQANTYTVTYNANGGSGAPASQTKTYGTALTLSSTKPTRTNYTFLGWATTKTATTAQYSAGGSYTANAAVTLYAVWKLAYKAPSISKFKAVRCDASGNEDESGTYALISCDYKCFYDTGAILTLSFMTPTSGTTLTRHNISGTSGSFSYTESGKSVDESYTVIITIDDGTDSTTATITLPGTIFPWDALAGGNGIAFGKNAAMSGYADFNFEILSRKNIYTDNDKNIYGKDAEGTAYSALIPVTASGNTSLGYGLYNAGKGNTHLYGNTIQFYAKQGVHLNGNDLHFDNETQIIGYDANGNKFSVFTPMSESGNTVIGYDHYKQASGNLNLYSHDIVHFVSNIATPGSYRPYRRMGDTLPITIRTAGYVTNSSKEVHFFVPFSEPIVGSPTVTVTSGNGFILRQGGKYTHGSAASTYVTPTKYTTARFMHHGITIIATFSDTTNADNNDAVGIYWDGTITLS